MTMTLRQVPAAAAEMMIRRPVADVFEAFIEPAVTTRFWFTKSSGRLAVGSQVRWDWEMYGVSTIVHVKEIEENKRIRIEWEEAYGYSTVEWEFTARSENETFVRVTNTGFQGDADEVVSQAIDSTGGFSLVLCALKALLEYNIELNVVEDKAPDAAAPGWKRR